MLGVFEALRKRGQGGWEIVSQRTAHEGIRRAAGELSLSVGEVLFVLFSVPCKGPHGM